MEEQGLCVKCKAEALLYYVGAGAGNSIPTWLHCHHAKEVKVCKWCEAWEKYTTAGLAVTTLTGAIRYLITRGQELIKCPVCGKDIK